jgi:hypothetical protein
MKKDDLLYRGTEMEVELEPFRLPRRGFHTAYEARLEFEGGDASGTAIVLYLEGGANCGCRYTFVYAITERVETGWAQGFRLPVPIRRLPENLHKMLQRLTPRPLLRPREVPGFDADGRHKDDWYTSSILVREIEIASVLGENARVFLLREGVYVTFPDGSYRLAPYREWFSFVSLYDDRVPDARQGDLLVFSEGPGWLLDLTDVQEEIKASVGRHTMEIGGKIEEWEEDVLVVRAPRGCKITHPEHPELVLQGGNYTIVHLPGDSRPFRASVDAETLAEQG